MREAQQRRLIILQKLKIKKEKCLFVVSSGRPLLPLLDKIYCIENIRHCNFALAFFIFIKERRFDFSLNYRHSSNSRYLSPLTFCSCVNFASRDFALDNESKIVHFCRFVWYEQQSMYCRAF